MNNIALVFTLACFCGCAWASDIAWDDISAGNTRLKTVLVSSSNPRLIYFGSEKGVFESEDNAQSWRNVLSLPSHNRAVNLLLADPHNDNFLYAATGNGLYYSYDKGKSWKRIFKGRNDSEKNCVALAILPQAIYLGTDSGLFLSRDRGRTWNKEGGILSKGQVLTIVYNPAQPRYIYIACRDGVFKSEDSGRSWERVFVAHPAEEEHDADEITQDQDESPRHSDIRYLSISPDKPNSLYLATSRGIYQSQDQGKVWDYFTDYGLLSKDIRFLLVSRGYQLYAVSKSGIFKLNGQRWEELSFGISAEEINFIALDSRNNLYAASDKGLFRAKLGFDISDNRADIIAIYNKDEPQISQVQQAAIRYAEVEPEKIARWRRQAAKRAWLPKVTVDMDRDIDRTTSSSIWGTYPSNGTPGRYFVGPDDETRYNNRNLGVSLTWELGDLIFSDDQTSIDVRSRLMVELREDILDEVNKTYFERLRIKIELDNLSIDDRKKRYEKELRLQELTASLDALTGGYFSQQMPKLKTGS